MQKIFPRKLTRKAPDKTCETKFLQMCSFFIILTSLHSLNLTLPLLFYVISIAILKFPLWFLASPTWFPTFFALTPRFPTFPRWFVKPAFLSHSSNSRPYSPHFPHSVPHFFILDFTHSLLSLNVLRIYFRKIAALVQKTIFPFVTTA